MKKINDTYVSLSEHKVKIGKNTCILSQNDIILSYLNPLLTGTGAVSEIRFMPFDADAQRIADDFFPNAEKFCEDGYLIDVNEDSIDIYANSERVRIYAAVCLWGHYDSGIGTGAIYNLPLIPFRAMKTFIPPKSEIPFFKEFIDLCVIYGFNTLVMEVGGAMEYKRHPEINEGWIEYADMFRHTHGKSVQAQKCMMYNKNSIHCENGGGSYLTQSELCALIDYANARGIDVIPEIPSLSHSDYLLVRHPELAENVADPIPDSYCPLHPEVYNLLFDVIDEVLEVFSPKAVHIAHDEWYSACICPRCRRQNPAELFANDVKKIYGYLKERNVEVIMWADMLAQCVDKNGNLRGSGMSVAKIPTDKTVEIKGRIYNVNNELWGLAGAQMAELGGAAVFHAPLTHPCIDTLPRDITMMNWMHHYEEDLDLKYLDHGFPMVYGNFYPRSFKNWFYCVKRGASGVTISNWSMFDLAHMQRMGVIFNMAYASMMMWNREFDERAVRENTLEVGHDLFLLQRKKATAKYSVEITHAVTEKIPHEMYWDGVTIDYDKDRLGYYVVEYADGTTEKRDIFYGYNIGVLHDADYDASIDPNGTNSHILEATYTCDYEIVDGKVYYRAVLNSDKKIVSVTPEIFSEYANTVKVLKISKCISNR